MRATVRALGRASTPITRAATAISPTRTLTLLGWHRIGNSTDGLTTTSDDFRRHLDVIEEWGAVVLDLEDALSRLAAGTLPERALALTFDDGYASVADVAWPELHRRGMPATLFAVSGYLDGRGRFPWDSCHAADSPLVRLMSASGVREVAGAGMAIGSHTVTHRWLPGLRAEEVDEELRRSRGELEHLLQHPVRGLAYPMGGWTAAVRDAAERAGYEHAITVDRGSNRTAQPRLGLRRAFAFDRAEDVRRQLDGGYTWMRPIEDRRRRREPTW